MQSFLGVLLPILLFVTSLFLILLVLIQRGRGGGLAGAFGGLGGQSAFGTKAGDLFTRITIVTAAVWIILCAASVKLLNDTGDSKLAGDVGANAATAPPVTGAPPQGGGSAPGAAGGGQAPAAGGQAPAAGDAAPATTAPAADGAAAPPASAPATGEAPASAPPAEPAK